MRAALPLTVLVLLLPVASAGLASPFWWSASGPASPPPTNHGGSECIGDVLARAYGPALATGHLGEYHLRVRVADVGCETFERAGWIPASPREDGMYLLQSSPEGDTWVELWTDEAGERHLWLADTEHSVIVDAVIDETSGPL